MERVEERTLMSSVIMSQFPAICMPVSESREAAPPAQGPSQAPSAGPRAKPGAKPAASPTPIAPKGLTATPVGNTVKLAWQKVPRAVDTIVLDYSSDGGTTWSTMGMLGKNAIKFTAEGLESGKTYQFKLWTMNNKGASPASDIVAAVLG
jgi:hypothetical protein